MTTSSQEAQKTLNTLDRLIVVADCMGIGKTPAQRAALEALRARQSALRDLIQSRCELARQKIVSLEAWRKGQERPARAPARRKLAAATLR
jgi:hypothetical protein